MGNPELTRLWSLNTDNMAACKSQSRYDDVQWHKIPLQERNWIWNRKNVNEI